MSWRLLIVANSILLGGSMVVARVLARDKVHANASFIINAGSFVFLWLSGLALLPLMNVVDDHVLTQYFWRFVGGGVAFALTNVATYKSLSYVDAATGTIFNTVNALFSVGMAALTLHEDLSTWQAAGGVILMAAIIYSALTLKTKNTKLSRRKLLYGLGFALLAGVVYGIAITNEKWLLEHMTSGSYIVYGWGWQMLASIGVAALVQPNKLALVKRVNTLKLLILLGVLKGIGGAAFVLAEIRSNNVALVTVIGNFKIIVVVLLGAWLLKERHKLRQKAVSAVGALAGLTVMFWR